MDDTVKYLIHADVTADGVVERSDVVGAVFGQTEGLLGDELDLRGLQQSSKVGRIDVDVDSEQGQSFGHLTIETSLDKVATATLAAALETITRIGPCRATVRVAEIEDVRAAKRREVVERAKELVSEGFTDTVMTSEEILAEVREELRVEDIAEYEGLPAGPRVTDSDAVVVVEGRADVLTLLRFGVKNAIAVEGTNVPDAVADLTRDRTVTVFLDGDRGGDLILEELSQVGEIDYVAFAPPGQSVEDLDRGGVFRALQEKVPYDAVSDMSTPRDAVAATDGSAEPAPSPSGDQTPVPSDPDDGDGPPVADASDAAGTAPDPPPDGTGSATGTDPATGSDPTAETDTDPPGDGTAGTSTPDPETPDATTDVEATGEGPSAERGASETKANEAGGSDEDSLAADASDDETAETDRTPDTLQGHVRAVIGDDSGAVRLLDDDYGSLVEADATDAFETVVDVDPVPAVVVLDDTLTQRILDVAAQRGAGQVVARELGEFTKRPTGVRIRTAEQLDPT